MGDTVTNEQASRSRGQLDVPTAVPAWLQGLWDVGAGLLVFSFYLFVAGSVAGRLVTADAVARHINGAERWLHLPSERAINNWTAGHKLLSQVANYHYAVGYLATTLGVVLWLRLTHRPNYARHVAALLAINVVAITLFWIWPCSPPRLLGQGGFVDTVETHGTWGSWGTGLVSSVANQHAAMPSLHVAWATWVAVTLLSQRVPGWLSRTGVLHIGTTTAVIVMTGNHWILDAAAGLALALTVELGTRFVFRRVQLHQARAEARTARAPLPVPGRPRPAADDEPTPAELTGEPAAGKPAAGKPAGGELADADAQAGTG
jgi:diacylglycerol O-acyltransferase